MNLSFHEKSLWLMFVSLVGVFGAYFAMVLPTHRWIVMPHQVALFVLAVVLLVIMQIAGTCDRDRRPGVPDRRARPAHRAEGTRNAAYVLATGVFLATLRDPVDQGHFIFAHLLLGFWVLAQLGGDRIAVFLHRRGVSDWAKVAASSRRHPRTAFPSGRDDASAARGPGRRHTQDGERDRGQQVLAVARSRVPDRAGVRCAAGASLPVLEK
jgi:hypothetical protein